MNQKYNFINKYFSWSIITVTCLLLLFLTLKANGQEYNINIPSYCPPSPTVAAFARYGEIPVNNSTGVPKIEIPIYNIKSGGLELPISLSYHASGIKVRDIASVAGLGWVLNAGGVIGQVVFGKNDELQPFKGLKSKEEIDDIIADAYSGPSYVNYDVAIEKLNDLNNGIYDVQSDRYSFNFNGYNGIFRYDFLTDAVRTIPYAPIKIERKKVDPQVLFPYYEITVEDGTRYIFSEEEASVNLTRAGAANRSRYLTEIVSSNKLDTIKLSYQPGKIITEYSYAHSLNWGPNYVFQPSAGIGCLNGKLVPGSPSQHFTNTPDIVNHEVKLLSSISCASTEVLFHYVDDRLDKRKERLSKIEVYSRVTGKLIKEVEFEHSYFGTSSDKNQRLRLDAILAKGEAPSASEKHSFKYKSLELPAYPDMASDGGPFSAFSEDYWGYYNGTAENSLIPSEYLPSEHIFYGGNRNPNPAFVQACMLEEIQYPTGGKTVFEFEPNTAGGYVYDYDDANQNQGILGGLRVKQVKNYTDAGSPPQTRTYEYTPGAHQYIQKELFIYSEKYYYIYNYTGGSSCAPLIEDTQRNSAVANPSYALHFGNGSPILYSLVTEYIGTGTANIGKNMYSFEIEKYYHLDQLPLSNPKFGHHFSFERGVNIALPSSVSQWKAADGQVTEENKYKIVRSSVNNYTYFKDNEFNIGISIGREANYLNIGNIEHRPEEFGRTRYIQEFVYADLKAEEDVPLLKSEVITDYFASGEIIQSTTNYEYDNIEHLQPTKKIVTTSEGKKLITYFKYPHDFQASSSVYNKMVSLHILNPVVEKSDYKGADFLQGIRTNHIERATDFIVVESIETKSGNNSYETRLRYHTYDEKGNVLTVSKQDAPPVSYLWGYNHTLPIAKVENAAFSQENFTATPSWLLSSSGLESYGEHTLAGSCSLASAQTVSVIRTYYRTSDEPRVCWVHIYNSQQQVVAYFRDELPSGTEVVVLTSQAALPAGSYTARATIEGTLPNDGQGFSMDVNVKIQQTVSEVTYSVPFHTSFEEEQNASIAYAKTGGKSHQGTYTVKLPPSGQGNNTYVLSYWKKTSGTPEWEYVEEKISISAASPGSRTVGQTGEYIDEVRLYPSGAQMTTYTYEPLVGVKTVCDINNRISYFNYDGLGRLVEVRDHEKNITNTYEYNYRQ